MISSCSFRYSHSSTQSLRHPYQNSQIKHRFYHTTKIALVSFACLLPSTKVTAYQYIEPKKFATEQSPQILKTLGANDALLKINAKVSDQMTHIISSQMVQGMATGTLTKNEWEKKYMRPDVLYIYRLGQTLAARAKRETKDDQSYVMEMADMFLGYGKHFERLKKYGLQANDRLVSPECDEHIALLSQKTSIHEFYVSILTDMIPYVVFANYLLRSIEPSDHHPWIEYARKYGDLNNKYAKEKLGKIIQVANEILVKQKVSQDKAEQLFVEGFSFEEWFIRHAFSEGFKIVPAE